ncbi:MAG: trypsin-like peptidase domain-containing protein [Proteobacteria bacterium]|nr:trypsin-like peptidase domain-containing protein [Pseudomonadota bacterium]MBU1640419.1 trypsin-like peptidase domain-containing protein [Pseudomonadota bacterium]
MKKVLFKILPVLVLLINMVSPAWAYNIFLKNGKVVETEACWQEGNFVVYEKYGGTIAMAMDKVERLQCDGPNSPPAAQEQKADPTDDMAGEPEPVQLAGASESNAQELYDEKDLLTKLTLVLKPQTPIEQANLATISIESDLGSGSGFFISKDGYILTNKHVVRVSDDSKEESLNRLNEAKATLREAEASLKNEKQRLENSEKNLRQDKASLRRALAGGASATQINSMRRDIKANEDYLKLWQQSYQKRIAEYNSATKQVDEANSQYRKILSSMKNRRYYKIYLADETELDAYLVKLSEKFDLALLKINGFITPHLQHVRSTTIPHGATLYAIGNPIGLRNSVTSGALSAFREEFIQTSADINPGNSGGPLVTEEGKVIGVNTKKLIATHTDGLGFALDIKYAFQEFGTFLGPVE